MINRRQKEHAKHSTRTGKREGTNEASYIYTWYLVKAVRKRVLGVGAVGLLCCARPLEYAPKYVYLVYSVIKFCASNIEYSDEGVMCDDA